MFFSNPSPGRLKRMSLENLSNSIRVLFALTQIIEGGQAEVPARSGMLSQVGDGLVRVEKSLVVVLLHQREGATL
jgi:hypothetical protein